MSEASPRVSVIVPIYNTQDRLPGTIASLIMQDLEDVELVLVNDGSTDNSLAICRDAAERDPRIRVVTGPNGGVCVARNRGLDVARGEWIAFCDSDDRVQPEIYTTLLDLARRERAELPCCALRDVGLDGTKEGIVDFQILGDRETIRGRDNVLARAFYPLLNGMKSVHGYLVTSLFRRDLVEARHLRFSPGIRVCEDEMFMLDYLLSTTTIAVVRKSLYDYLRLESSACSTYYTRDDDFKREYNWYLRARERQRIFADGGLGKSDSRTLRKLMFRTHYHEMQANWCDPRLSWRQKMAKTLELRRHVRAMHAAPAGLSAKAFHFCLLWTPPLLPLLLWAKRRKNDVERSLDNALR